MTAVLISGPALEPVSLNEAKAHLRMDTTDEDTLISSLIAAARLHVEAYTHRVFITQTWVIYLDQWPQAQPLRLPITPVQSVSAINIYDQDNTFVTTDATNYVVDALSTPARILWRGPGATPRPQRKLNGIEIIVTAGYGAAGGQVPQPIRQAILMLIAQWFEHRQPPTLEDPGEAVPPAVTSMLQAYTPVRL
jgi:uncharacterized phiE125 gp8 family phage protein